MDLTLAAVWVDTLRKHPDRCLIAADWFDEQNRSDLGGVLRRRAAAHQESGAADELEQRHLSLDAQAWLVAVRIAFTHPLKLLGQIASLGVQDSEQFELIAPPLRGHSGPYTFDWRIWQPSGSDMPLPGENFELVESVTLIPHKFEGKVKWREDERRTWCYMWAGRAGDGMLMITYPPDPGEFETADTISL